MKERPILFSAPMVRAILTCADCGLISLPYPCAHCGSTKFRKTQTRRAMAVQPPDDGFELARLVETTALHERKHENKLHWVKLDGLRITESSERYFSCPYGVPGDSLWVKETWWKVPEPSLRELRDGADTWPKPIGPQEQRIAYGADDEDADTVRGWGWKLRPSIFMYRWASRITLDITERRVQLVRDISEEDAQAEGIEPFVTIGSERDKQWYPEGYRANYKLLWDKLNAKRGFGWAKNPWVWALTFKRAAA